MFKQFLRNSMVLCFFILISHSVFSVPAFPSLITVKQPNGDELTIKMKGDERVKWMESEDGYTLLYDHNKNIVYASIDEAGDLISSTVIAQDIRLRSPYVIDFLEKTPRFLSYSQKQKEAVYTQLKNATDTSQVRSTAGLRSTIGTAKGICALVQFPDKPLVFTVDDFSQLMNKVGYQNGRQNGSVRDFYLENSYGLLDLNIKVVGPYTASHNHAYYGGQGHENELAREVANYTFSLSTVTPADYDNDNDGYIDTFHFLFAGYGEEAGGGDDCIWSHKSGFWPAMNFNGKKLDTYSCSPELRSNSGEYITYIGVITHELCHIFGAPDFYDVNGSTGGEFVGTGNWDLMAGGSWNNSGASPAHINMYQKIAFGWVNPVELKSTQDIVDMPNSAENPVAYVIKSAVPSEYYVLENRQKSGFDGYVPGTGLLIYHVSITNSNISRNDVNDGHPQRVYPVAAGSSYQIPDASPASYGSINSSYCTYPNASFNKNTEFTDQSTPAAFLWNGARLGKPIKNITQKNKLISFNFMPNDLYLNLQAQVSGNKVNLTWIMPASDKTILGYNVYKNSVLVQFTNNTAYRDQVAKEGTYKYGVSLVFENEESPVQEVEVNVNWTAIDPVAQHPVSVYPNPVKSGESITIDLGDTTDDTALSLYNVSGQLVLQIHPSEPVIKQTLNLPQGIYFLRITKVQQTETIKIILSSH